MLHHEKDIPAIEVRPDSLADCPVQPSYPITFSDLHTQPGQDALETYRPLCGPYSIFWAKIVLQEF